MNKDRYYRDIRVGDKIEIIETEDNLLQEYIDNFGSFMEIYQINTEEETVLCYDCILEIAMGDFIKVSR